MLVEHAELGQRGERGLLREFEEKVEVDLPDDRRLARRVEPSPEQHPNRAVRASLGGEQRAPGAELRSRLAGEIPAPLRLAEQRTPRSVSAEHDERDEAAVEMLCHLPERRPIGRCQGLFQPLELRRERLQARQDAEPRRLARLVQTPLALLVELVGHAMEGDEGEHADREERAGGEDQQQAARHLAAQKFPPDPHGARRQ